MTSERFTNEMINAIRNRSTAQFREKYRNIDVLLIDEQRFVLHIPGNGMDHDQERGFTFSEKIRHPFFRLDIHLPLYRSAINGHDRKRFVIRLALCCHTLSPILSGLP